MSVRLTETAIRKAIKDAATDAKRLELADAGCPGLRLRVTPAGAASWILGCRDRQGHARRFPVGSFPAMGISDARDGARDLRARVMAGADPIADRRRERAQAEAAKNGDGTLRALLDLYEHKRGTALRSWAHSRKRVDRVFARFLRHPVATLTASALQMVADDYPAAPSASFAVRTLRLVLKWAAQRGIADSKLADLRAPEPVKRRKRVLTERELAALLPVLRAGADAYTAGRRFVALTGHADVSGLHWRQIDLTAGTLTYRTKPAGKFAVLARKLPAAALDLLRSLPAGAPSGAVFPDAKAHSAALRFMLLTLARREEASAVCWREIDLQAGSWTIPGGRTKNGEPHTVPLSRQAVALLRGLPAGAPDESVFRTVSGSLIGNWDRETKAIQQASGTGGWTRHDLRRTGATLLGEMGELPDIIEAALNHVAIRSPLAAIYNRSRYRPQVAAALQRLADRLDGIEEGAARVVPLRSVS
jgi:integrase